MSSSHPSCPSWSILPSPFALRPKFREAAKLLAQMDRLVLRFRKSDVGIRFADTWKAVRTIRDLGDSAPGGRGSPTPPNPPTA